METNRARARNTFGLVDGNHACAELVSDLSVNRIEIPWTVPQPGKISETRSRTHIGIPRSIALDIRHSRQCLLDRRRKPFQAARDVAQVQCGAVRVDVQKFRDLPAEISRRLLVQAVMWVNGGGYPPRRAGIAGVQAAVNDGRTTTLDGCQISFAGEVMWIYRELNAVRDISGKPGGVWDNRWHVEGPENDPRLHVGPLGEDGLALCPDWREHGLPRGAMLSLPAIWNGSELVATPVFDGSTGWSAEIAGGQDVFANLAREGKARDRIVTHAQVIAAAPEVIIGSWCGKKFRPEKVSCRAGWQNVPAVAQSRLHEVKSTLILQPGPAALTDGLDALERAIWGAQG